mgnify:CR=1 FL=1
MFQLPLARKHILAFLLGLIILLPIYFSTLQTMPNGSENYYMIDVAETQIVLNTWGTLHATGYPLYVMTGNILVAAMRLMGLSPAAAPGIVALLWGVLALALIYTLAVHISKRPLVAAAMTILFGLTRTVWIHNSIAEIYSFGLVFLALLLLIALWEKPVRGRIYRLAFIGGLGVFHHRALLMVAPALIYAVWPEWVSLLFRRTSQTDTTLGVRQKLSPQSLVLSPLFFCLLLGLLGFLPYLYLPLRAKMGAAWVYGEPGTWAGLWDQFTGREAERFIGAPSTLDGILANIRLVTNVVITDVTLPGLLAGIVGLALGARNPLRRRLVMVLLLNAGVALIFHYLFYTDILSALILPVIVSLGVGWGLLAEAMVEWAITPTAKAGRLQNIKRTEGAEDSTDDAQPPLVGLIQGSRPALAVGDAGRSIRTRHASSLLVFALALVLGAYLYTTNAPFITSLTHDPTGVQTIALARQTPPGSALMIAWGPRHFATGFARDVMGELPDVTLVDHKADFRALAARMPIYTPDFTFYRYPASWWEEQLGAPVYPHAQAAGLIALATQPERGAGDTLAVQSPTLECSVDMLTLRVAWYTPDVPARDLSAFVHLLDAGGAVIAQGDQAAPVFGWRPLTTWTPDEIVRDVYTLPRLRDGETIRFGLYSQREDGTFENVVVEEMGVECAD